MTALTLYSRPGCHLCDDMKAIVTRVASAMPGRLQIEEVDISTDPDLERRYGLEIPVLVVDGKPALSAGNPSLLAILPALVVAAFTRSLIATVLAGVGVYWMLN